MAEQLSVNAETDALVCVHVQRDFCAGGALPVPDGDGVVPVLNEWLRQEGLLKIATRDWHPADHCSFREQGGPWPPHCVQGSPGAEFHQGLASDWFDRVVSAATDPACEAHSAFDDGRLLRTLRRHRIARLWIGGVATEYSVRATVMDALRHGFAVFVLQDAVRGIEARAGDVLDACLEMEGAGARLVESGQVTKLSAGRRRGKRS